MPYIYTIILLMITFIYLPFFLKLDEAGRRCASEEDMATLAKRIGEIQTAQENLKLSMEQK